MLDFYLTFHLSNNLWVEVRIRIEEIFMLSLLLLRFVTPEQAIKISTPHFQGSNGSAEKATCSYKVMKEWLTKNNWKF